MKHFFTFRNTRSWLTMAPALIAGFSASTIAVAAEDGEGKLVLEEVIVTTTKYQEELIEQPLSITQFNAEQRNLTATASATDMFRLTPGIEISDRGVTIRGVGRNTATSTLGTTEPVAYYVNGFYMPDSNVIGENTLIGGNVQILRGPQGTRYGTNAIGGAANLISRRPTDTFMGEALLGYGKYDWNTQGVTTTSSARVSSASIKKSGYRRMSVRSKPDTPSTTSTSRRSSKARSPTICTSCCDRAPSGTTTSADTRRRPSTTRRRLSKVRTSRTSPITTTRIPRDGRT
jgi:outer membrane receptor protein involved in Fe transport